VNLIETLQVAQLKRAAIVLKALADGFQNEKTKDETMQLVTAVIWAIQHFEATQTKGE
jgi:hypothetical protein